MSRLFNNKYSILVLVAIAILFCASIIVLPAATDINMSTDVPEMIDMHMTEAENNQARSLKSVDISNLFWNETYKRDPFSNKASVNSNNTSIANKDVSSNHLPKLTGFIAGTESRLAVLDGQVVGEGNAVNDYRVVNIDARGVQLSRGGKHVVLTLGVER